VSKRTGKYGDPTRPDPPVFGERKGGGAPLPLLTQPMIAVDVREVREIDPKQTLIDGPVPTLKLDTAALMQAAAVVQGKIEPSALVHGRPTVMMGPQVKPTGSPPQIDLTQRHLPEDNVDPRLQLSGLPAINRELGRRFPREFVKGLLIGTAAVALLIYAVFRTVRLTLLTLLPTAAGFVWSAGWLALARVELDLFSMFAAVTCVGIAVNYGIYVLHRYAIEGSEDVREVLNRTGAAILIACATALVGFGTLIISSYPPLRVFGIVSVVTLLCCVTASLMLLPAILIQSQR